MRALLLAVLLVAGCDAPVDAPRALVCPPVELFADFPYLTPINVVSLCSLPIAPPLAWPIPDCIQDDEREAYALLYRLVELFDARNPTPADRPDAKLLGDVGAIIHNALVTLEQGKETANRHNGVMDACP